jgi:CRP-like cAMP-binding protein
MGTVGGVVHMTVVRLRTSRDEYAQAGIARVRAAVAEAEALPAKLAERLTTLLDRETAACRGWSFVMVEPDLNAEVIGYLSRHSRRPLKAVQLWAQLFRHLPPDANVCLASRAELAEAVGCTRAHVAEILGELEAIGAVYRRRDGRSIRIYVNPALGTHLGGAARDQAQAEAPKLRLVEPAG